MRWNTRWWKIKWQFRCHDFLGSVQSPERPVLFTTACKQSRHACVIMCFNNCIPVSHPIVNLLSCRNVSLRACLNLLNFSICCIIHQGGLHNCLFCLVAINVIYRFFSFLMIEQCSEHVRCWLSGKTDTDDRSKEFYFCE